MEFNNLIILVATILLLVSIFTSLISFRIGAPLLLIFLGVGLAAGEDGIGGISFDNTPAAFLIGSVALAIILFLFGWNQYLWPLLFTTDKDMATAVIALKNLIPRSDSEPAWNIAMSGALLTMLPPTLVILLLQRWFLKGLVDSSK